MLLIALEFLIVCSDTKKVLGADGRMAGKNKRGNSWGTIWSRHDQSHLDKIIHEGNQLRMMRKHFFINLWATRKNKNRETVCFFPVIITIKSLGRNMIKSEKTYAPLDMVTSSVGCFDPMSANKDASSRTYHIGMGRHMFLARSKSWLQWDNNRWIPELWSVKN